MITHIGYTDAQSDVKRLRLFDGQKFQIKYGPESGDALKVEHVVEGSHHILRGYTAQGRLIGVADYGNGQSRFSNYEKALEAFKKRLSDHLYMLANSKGVKTTGLY